MPRKSTVHETSISLAQLKRIDEVCERFEAAWGAASSISASAGALKTPRIEDYLDSACDILADELFRELLMTELEVRSKCGAESAIQGYLDRFPQFGNGVRQVFEEFAKTKQNESPLLSSDGRFATNATEGFSTPAGILRPGTQLGPYKIESLLGAGGMGIVYRGADTRLDRPVAVKVLPQELAQNPSRLARFEREAKAVSRLAHPHIVVLYDIGSQDGVSYVVMELLEGETLRRTLQTSTLLVEQARRLSKEIAEALHAAHQRGVVHRDIKPENLFVTNEGRAKVLDFGLATLEKLDETDASEFRTNETSHGAVGTVGYMSPEQIRGQPADGAADVFSLGCVLYEMLVGEKAFAKDSAINSYIAALEEEPAALREDDLRLSEDWKHLLEQCLAKDPDRRPSAGQLAQSLREMGPPLKNAPAHQNRRKYVLSLVGAVVCLAGLWWAVGNIDRGPSSARIEAERNVVLGKVEWGRRTEQSLERARNYFRSAMELDPTLATAHSGLALTYITLGERGIVPSEQAYNEARESANTALKRDPQSAEAHFALAMIYFEFDWNFPQAKNEFKKGLALDPIHPTGHQWFAELLSALGEHEQAIEHIHLAQRADPQSSIVATVKGVILFKAGRLHAAERQFKKASQDHGDFQRLRGYLIDVYEQTGALDDAIVQWRYLLGEDDPAVAALKEAHLNREQQGYLEMRRNLHEAMNSRYPLSEVFLAGIHARLGEKNRAFEILHEALRTRDGALAPNIKVNPVFENLRSDPRYGKLLRDIGFPGAR